MGTSINTIEFDNNYTKSYNDIKLKLQIVYPNKTLKAKSIKKISLKRVAIRLIYKITKILATLENWSFSLNNTKRTKKKRTTIVRSMYNKFS